MTVTILVAIILAIILPTNVLLAIEQLYVGHNGQLEEVTDNWPVKYTYMKL